MLALLSVFYEHLFYAIYAPLGDVWDILVLVNSAVNFVVYCTMNRRFRYTVVDCFGFGVVPRSLSGASGCDGAVTELGGTRANTHLVQCRTTTTETLGFVGDARRVTLAVYTAMDTAQSLELQPSTV